MRLMRVLTREVETPLPSYSPHGHMRLRVGLVGSHGRLYSMRRSHADDGGFAVRCARRVSPCRPHCVSPTVSPPLCLPHCVSLTVSLPPSLMRVVGVRCGAQDVSLTVSLSHCVSLTASLSPPLPHRLSLTASLPPCLPHCVSLTVSLPPPLMRVVGVRCGAQRRTTRRQLRRPARPEDTCRWTAAHARCGWTPSSPPQCR
jgi:hypothetical protein